MASEIKAGKAYVELFLKGDFQKSLDRASKQLKAFGDQVGDIGKKMAALGASITAPLLLAAQRFATMGDEIQKASQRTGVGAEALSTLKYAAEQSGSSFEDLETGIKKMNKTIFEAEGFSKDAEKALAGVGLTVKELQGLTPDQQFLKIGEALNGVQDAGAKAALSMEIFGKGGTQLLPFFERGPDGIKALTDRAKELGVVMGGEDAKAATKFSEVLDDIWKQFDALTFSVGAAIAQALQPFAESATHILATVIDWTKENRTLIIAVLTAGVALTTAGVAVIGLGAAFSLAGVVIGGFVSVFGLVAAAIGVLLNPIVLIGGALIGLATYFTISSKVGAECLAWLGEKFNELKDTASEAFGGIADALSAGDIQLAAKILWTGLQAAWAEGTGELMQYWLKFKASFLTVAANAFYGSLEAWEEVKAALQSSWADVSAYFQTIWQNTIAFLGGLWDGFLNTFRSAWDTAINAVAKGLNYIHGLWDKSFDSKKANQAADAMVSNAQQQRDQADITAAQKREADKQAAVKDIENKRKAKQAEIANDKQKTLTKLVDENAATDSGVSQQSKEDAAALTQKKIDLEKQLKDLRSKAGSEKTAKKKADDGPKPLDKANFKSLTDVLQNRQSVDSPAKAQGIFGAAGIQSLQGGSIQKDIAKNTADSAKYLKDMSKNSAVLK